MNPEKENNLDSVALNMFSFSLSDMDRCEFCIRVDVFLCRYFKTLYRYILATFYKLDI